MAILLVAIAIFSIQNIEAVSLKFLTLRSIDIPVGILLAFASAIGIFLGALIPALFTRKKNRRAQRDWG